MFTCGRMGYGIYLQHSPTDSLDYFEPTSKLGTVHNGVDDPTVLCSLRRLCRIIWSISSVSSYYGFLATFHYHSNMLFIHRIQASKLHLFAITTNIWIGDNGCNGKYRCSPIHTKQWIPSWRHQVNLISFRQAILAILSNLSTLHVSLQEGQFYPKPKQQIYWCFAGCQKQRGKRRKKNLTKTYRSRCWVILTFTTTSFGPHHPSLETSNAFEDV